MGTFLKVLASIGGALGGFFGWLTFSKKNKIIKKEAEEGEKLEKDIDDENYDSAIARFFRLRRMRKSKDRNR